MMWYDALHLKFVVFFFVCFQLLIPIRTQIIDNDCARTTVCVCCDVSRPAHLGHPQPIERRIKSAFVDFHVISRLRRLTLYTSTVQIVDHIKHHKYYCELITYKSKEKCKHFIYNLNNIEITCATDTVTATVNHFNFNKFVHKINTSFKMKDFVNGNTINEVSDSLIVDQKSAYHNGISNGDR